MKKRLLLPIFIALSYLSFGQAPTLELDDVLISSTNMGQPWGMSFISNDELLFTEKSGKLFKYIISTDSKTEIFGLPSIAVTGQGGLLDVALHPDFENNSYVYLSYSISGNGGYTLAVGRGVLSGNQLTNFTEIFRALPFRSGSNHFGSRIAFDSENHIYFSSSDRQEQDNAQLLTNHSGKIIRLNDDGTVPNDNPFVGIGNAESEIFSYGHRNIQGLVITPDDKIYAHEHGPQGGDELNIIEAGNNYGWPEITFGVNYGGGIITEDTAKEGMEQPIRYWVPSIAPCGMAIVPLEDQEEGELNFIIGALAGQQIQWVKIQDDKHIATYSFMEGYARFRDVEVAPDGKLYALTESPNRLILLKTNKMVTSVKGKKNVNEMISAYPNPAKEFIQIKMQEAADVSIYSSRGEHIRTFSKAELAYNGSEMKIDIGDLNTGMYLIELKSESTTKMIRCNKL